MNLANQSRYFFRTILTAVRPRGRSLKKSNNRAFSPSGNNNNVGAGNIVDRDALVDALISVIIDVQSDTYGTIEIAILFREIVHLRKNVLFTGIFNTESYHFVRAISSFVFFFKPQFPCEILIIDGFLSQIWEIMNILSTIRLVNIILLLKIIIFCYTL